MVRLNLQLFAYTGNSIVDYLKSEGKDSSFAARKQLAESNGIKNYTGTSSQNTQLLNALRSGSSNTSKTTTNSDNVASSATTTKINGVDQATIDKMNSTFEQSKDVTSLENKAQGYFDSFEELASKTDIVDQSTWDTINSKFETPEAVTQADAWLSEQLGKIQSGKTSWTDKYNAAIDKYLNREEFEYDVDKDPLFQQALASAMNSGKTAMQDTIGQASALTGGYGSTYATSAGNQAYNSFIEDAYNNLPEYYQMALSAYEAEGQELYNQAMLLGDADAKEYERLLTGYDATYQHRNQLYNEAYTSFRDTKTDAFNSATLQLDEYGQLVENAHNLFTSAQDMYESKYTKEYTSWADSVTQAQQYAQMLNSDYWSQETYDQTEKWNQANLDYNYAQLDLERDKFNAEYESDGNGGYRKKSSTTDGSSTSKLTNTEVETLKKLYVEAGGGEAGMKEVNNHLSIIGKNNLGDEGNSALKSALEGEDVPVYYQDWTISNDTKNHNFLWLSPDDGNDEYSNGTDTMTFKQLKKAINNSDLSKEEKEKRIEALRKQSKN